MPGYKTHVVCTFLCALVLFIVSSQLVCLSYMISFSISDYIVIMAGALAGAIAPDIDTTSKGRILWSALLTCCILLGLLFSNSILAAVCAIILLTSLIAVHRGLFHSWWLFVLFSLFLLFFLYSYMPCTYWHIGRLCIISFLCGACGHLLLDYFF